jgi:hypothetical protein
MDTREVKVAITMEGVEGSTEVAPVINKVMVEGVATNSSMEEEDVVVVAVEVLMVLLARHM